MTATCQTLLKIMPPGITPPYIVRYSATSVPIAADRRQQRHADRTADFRLRRELHHPAAGHRAGRAGAAALGRQAAADHGRSRPRRALRPRPVAQRCQHRHRQSEPDHPGRHGQDRQHGVQRQAQQQPGLDRRRSTTSPSRSVNGVPIYVKDVAHVRDGLRGADQRRPPRRPPGGAHDHPQGRRALRRWTWSSGSAMPCRDIQAQLPPELEDGTALRPVGLRPGGRRGRAQGRGDRRRADRADDPAVPRLVAEHADRRHLDPAVDPHLDHRPVGAGPVAQHDDAGRHGAGGRHPGGRRHGGDRERPPQHRP